MYLGCKQKCSLLIAISKPDNKKLVTLVPTGKTGRQGQFFPPQEADHSWSLSNPFTRLIRPEEQRILQATHQPVAGEVLLGGRPVRRRRRLLTGNSSLAVLTQVVHLFPDDGFRLLTSSEQKLLHLGFVKMTQIQIRGWPKGLKTVYTKLF